MPNRSTPPEARRTPSLAQPEPRNLSTRPESPAWWRRRRSLSEIAELINQVVNEKCETERRLSRLIRDHEELKSRLGKLDAQPDRPGKDAAPPRSKPGGGPGSGEGRFQAEMAARQRLMDQEIERRVHALQIEWKQERHHMRQQIVSLQKELEVYRLASGDF